jgi:non-heme chloroperoxidase
VPYSVAPLTDDESAPPHRGALARAVLTVACLMMVGSRAASGQASAMPQWSDPSPHRVLRVTVAHDVQLEVLDWGGPTRGGSGAALVFLAGLGNTAHVFDAFAPRFRDRFHVYGITRRGNGASSAPDSGYDAATRARDIVTVLDSLHLGQAVLIGHSIAGDELSKVAVTYPARVRALVYLDAYDNGPARREAMRAIVTPRGLAPHVTPGDSVSPAAVAAFYGRMLGGTYPESETRATFVFGPDGHLQADGPGEKSWPKVGAGTEASAYRQIKAPTLGLFATYPGGTTEFFPGVDFARLDDSTRAAAARYFTDMTRWEQTNRDRMRAELPRVVLIELPHAGHYVFLTQPDRVEHEIRTFLGPIR